MKKTRSTYPVSVSRQAPPPHLFQPRLAVEPEAVPSIQRSLFVSPTHVSPPLPPGDSAAGLNRQQRFRSANRLVTGLCNDFHVNHSGQVVERRPGRRTAAQYASGSNPVGCCCLNLITQSPNRWDILVTEHDGPHTRGGTNQLVISSDRAPIAFGSFTSGGALTFQGAVSVFGHELCGHAVLMDQGIHPPNADRIRTDVHDPTVRIENQISTERGVNPSNLRGLASSGVHRGESVAKVEILFGLGATTVPSLSTNERKKLTFAQEFIRNNNTWVDILGHSDNSGNAAARNTASLNRAQKVKDFLLAGGISPTITKHGLRAVKRFTRVEGLGNTVPPTGRSRRNQRNWRRVEILMAGFPAGAQRPVSGTPSGVASVATPAGVGAARGSANACLSLIANTAYPVSPPSSSPASRPTSRPAVTPPIP
ncbi:MAG: OmpA family protein [Bacteroidota bacterium]